MNGELMKSLVDLIDESLAEIEELKKSDRFSASEITMGDSEGLAGKDKNGSMGKEDAEKADEDDSETKKGRQPQEEGDTEEDHDKKKKKDDDDMDKADGKNSEADPNAGHHQAVSKEEDAEKAEDDMDKGEMMAGDSDKGSSTGGSAGKNSEADPNAGKHKMAKSEDEGADFGEELKKSREESEALIKSYIDEKVGGLEAKLAGIADAVKELADSPVPSKGASYKNVTPLTKSEPEGETLSKTEVADKLLELKKSGENVSTEDITSIELGSPGELARIVNKYNIK